MFWMEMLLSIFMIRCLFILLISPFNFKFLVLASDHSMKHLEIIVLSNNLGNI
jgi:hypothetical protein